MSHLYLLKLTSLRPEMTSTLGCRTDFTAQWQQALWEMYPPFTSICSAVK